MKTLPHIAVLCYLLSFGSDANANGYYIPTTYNDPGILLPSAELNFWPYYDQSHAWLQFNERSSQLNGWLGYPQSPSQGLYAMALDAQRRGAFAYADVLRRESIAQMERELTMAGLEASAKARLQMSELVAAKQEQIRKAYAELQPTYDDLMRRRRDLKGQEEIRQYNIEAARYTAKLRQLRRAEVDVNMMMRSAGRF
jgi:hypothetical protein